jgi:hypothetical protein
MTLERALKGLSNLTTTQKVLDYSNAELRQVGADKEAECRELCKQLHEIRGHAQIIVQNLLGCRQI